MNGFPSRGRAIATLATLWVAAHGAGCGPDTAGPCSDSGDEVCNGRDDDCDGTVDEQPEDGALCDDGVECTADLCQDGGTCVSEASDALCEDEIECTVGSCTESGCTQEPSDALCDDGVSCTVDRCDPTGGCSHTTDDAACDDGQACTTERCDATQGCLYTADDAACDDGVSCTLDTCAPFTGCSRVPSELACEDGNPCTDDRCDPTADCQNVANAAECEDGSLCTSGDACVAGACVPGAPSACDDLTPCTDDACDPTVGCVAPATPSCSYRGVLGGYYEGPYTVVFDVTAGGTISSMSCEGNARVTVDESRGVHIQGVGEKRCVTVLSGSRLEQTHSGTAEGMVTGLTAELTLRSGAITAPWSATFELDGEGVPLRLSGTSMGTVREEDFVTTVGATGLVRSLMLAALPSNLPYTLTGTLERVPRPGTCCGPGGCGPTDDYTCEQRGHRFLPDGAGECCTGASCVIATADDCSVLGAPVFVPSTQGACCLAGSECRELPSEACEFYGGRHVTEGICADGNADGYADLCGPPPDFGRSRTEPSTCTRSPDGRRLDVDVPGAPSLALETSTTWSSAGATYATTGTVGLVTPIGNVPIPTVTSLSVNCAAPLAISGTSSGAPQVGAFADFSGIGVPTGPSFDLGYAYGYEIRAMDVPGPFGDARSYFFAHATTGTSIQVGSGITIDATPGDEFLFGVDTRDPAVIIAVSGDSLSTVSGGLVQGVGLGVSRGGHLSVRSVRDLYDGAGFAPVVSTGHIYRSGAFPLIPYPNLPANIVLDGETIVDVGRSADLISPITQAIVSGDVGPVRDAVGASRVDEVLADLTIAGNANSVSLDVGPISFDIGNAAFRIDGAGLTFASGSLTPGVGLGDGSASLFSAFSAISFRRTQIVYGRVESGGFQVTIEGDFQAGPFLLTGGAVIIDSARGIRIRGGHFEIDFQAFIEQLLTLLDCDFSSGVRCTAGGIEVADFQGTIDGGGFFLSGSLGVAGFSRIELGARVAEGGSFTLQGFFENGLPGFNSTRAYGTLTDRGVAISTEWTGIDRRVLLTGDVSFDGRFELTGTTEQSIAGFQLNEASVVVNNDALQIDGVLYLIPAGTGLGRNEIRALVRVAPGAGEWTLEATGSLEPLGYQLASARIYGSSAIGNRVMFEGRAGAGPLEAQLSGEIVPSPFTLTGRGDIRVGGFTLADGSITINSSGMSAFARIDVLSARLDLMGTVQSNGCFSFSSMADASLPFGALSTSINNRIYLADARCGTGGSGPFRRSGVVVEGDVRFGIGERDFNLRYGLSSTGSFNAATTFERDVDVDVARLDGEVTLGLSNRGFSGSYTGRACVIRSCSGRFTRSFSATLPQIRIDPPGPQGSIDIDLF